MRPGHNNTQGKSDYGYHNKKHRGGSLRATPHSYVIILTKATVSLMQRGVLGPDYCLCGVCFIT